MEITTINLDACPLQYLSIGYVGETGARAQVFDFSAWAAEYGAGILQLLLQRPGDAEPYPVVLDIDGTTATWTPDETDTAAQGQGQAQLVYTVGGVVVKNAIFRVLVAPSLGASGDPPEPYEDWLQRLLTIAAEAQQSAIDAAGSAEAAGTSAGAAAGSAGAAAQSALDAEAAKTGAETAATTAGQSAALARAKAAEAAEAARIAGENADYAQQQNIAAGYSAESAHDDAERAAQSAEDAQAALEAAQLAADAAGTFADDAEASKTAAALSAAGAAQAKTDAETAATDAAASEASAAASASVAQALIDKIPDIEAEIDTKAPAIYESIGPAAIASFADGADDMPLRTLTVDIPTTQSGTGDPSPENVRPFVGRTTVTVTRTGGNLLGGKQFADDLAASCTGETRDGNAVYLSRGSNNVNSAVAQRVQMLRGGFAPGTHTIIIAQGETDTGASLITVFYTDGSSTAIGASQYNAAVKRWRYVSAASKTIRYLRMNRDNSAPIEYDCDHSGVFVGNAPIDTTVPYDGGVLNIPLPTEAGTVYAGTLSVNQDGSAELAALPHYASYNGETLVGPWLSSMDVYAEGATPTIGAEVVDLGGEATVYQLTAEQLRTLAGVNNIWSNAGDVTVEYPADTKSYIDEQTAALSGEIDTLTDDVDALEAAQPKTVTVTGATPVIAAVDNTRYKCGEVSTLDITLPASGIVDVVFESGTMPTVLTVTPPTGVTLRWANGFDPDVLEANTVYEVNICDGLGVAASWAV